MPMQVRRTTTANNPPTNLAEGQLAVEMADPLRLWVGVPTSIDPSGRRLIVPETLASGATPPATGNTASDIFYNTTTNQLMYYDGTAWQTLLADAPSDGSLYARRDGAWSVLNIPDVPVDVSILPVGGQLRLNGTGTATTLRFVPFNGDWIRIAGQYYPIPPGGVVSPASNTLTVSTNYYVYMFDNAGTLTIQFSQTGHTTSSTPGNVGTEVMTGNESRTLIGFARNTGAMVFSNLATDRLVRSWQNRQTVTMWGGSTNPNFSTFNTNFASFNFLAWAGEAVVGFGTGGFTGNPGATLFNLIMQFNGGGWASQTASIGGNWTSSATATGGATALEQMNNAVLNVSPANGAAAGSAYLTVILGS